MSQISEIIVVKRNGTREPFQTEKVSKVVEAAGLLPQQARTLAERIAIWLQDEKKTEITSTEIGDRVYLELQGFDQYAAGLFRWYQQTKNQPPSPANT